jgi:hypothetical protein
VAIVLLGLTLTTNLANTNLFSANLAHCRSASTPCEIATAYAGVCAMRRRNCALRVSSQRKIAKSCKRELPPVPRTESHSRSGDAAVGLRCKLKPAWLRASRRPSQLGECFSITQLLPVCCATCFSLHYCREVSNQLIIPGLISPSRLLMTHCNEELLNVCLRTLSALHRIS